jgi:hypothetical protein
MKRKILALLAGMLMLPASVWAAGTCKVSNVTSTQNANSRVPDAETVIITLTCTADASAHTYPSTSIPLTGSYPVGGILNAYNLTGYVLYQVGQTPGTTEPTANYTVTITDADGFALDLGLLTSNGSASAAQLTSITSATTGRPVVRSALTVAITGNSVNSAQITLDLIFKSSPSVASGSGSGGSTGQAVTFNNSGSGAASGATFNGSSPVTVSTNTIGAAASNASTTVNGQTCTLGSICGNQIAQITVSGSTTTNITFTSIPATPFPHLKLSCHLRTNVAQAYDDIFFQINGDTGNNYDYGYVFGGYGAGSSYSSSNGSITAGANGDIGNATAASDQANSFAQLDAVFDDYANTSFFKTWVSQGERSNINTGGEILTQSFHGQWRNTAAITSIKLYPATGPDFLAGSVCTLSGAN